MVAVVVVIVLRVLVPGVVKRMVVVVAVGSVVSAKVVEVV
jgi:hypothetical protein